MTQELKELTAFCVFLVLFIVIPDIFRFLSKYHEVKKESFGTQEDTVTVKKELFEKLLNVAKYAELNR